MHFRKSQTVFKKDEEESVKSTKDTKNKEKVASGCSHSFGYLAVRPKNSLIPQDCLCCKQVIDCMYKTKK
jgi:hypothetical protein